MPATLAPTLTLAQSLALRSQRRPRNTDFSIEESGNYYVAHDLHVRFCDPLEIVAGFCDPCDSNFGRILTWTSPLGVRATLPVPMAWLGRHPHAVVRALTNCGLRVDNRRLLLHFLFSFKPTTFRRFVPR